MTSIPVDRRTRATVTKGGVRLLRVVVYTRVHTPRRCGLALSAGVLDAERFVEAALADQLLNGRHY